MRIPIDMQEASKSSATLPKNQRINRRCLTITNALDGGKNIDDNDDQENSHRRRRRRHPKRNVSAVDVKEAT